MVALCGHVTPFENGCASSLVPSPLLPSFCLLWMDPTILLYLRPRPQVSVRGPTVIPLHLPLIRVKHKIILAALFLVFPRGAQGEPTPPISAPQPEPIQKKFVNQGNGMIPKPSQIDISSAEESSSFANECVLRAHTAGDVDPFHRETNAHRDDHHDMGFFDWTRLAMSPSLPRHIQFARSIDWASTPLGPIEYWSNDLRAMCNLIM